MLKKQIPNLVTAANLASGCLAIIFAVTDQPVAYIAYCVWLGAFFDFFDGLLARLLNVSGDFGKQLDSLADLVTFGITPFLTLFLLLKDQHLWVAGAALVLVVASAWRLAKFNIDTRQSTVFMGVPTPANALFFTSLPFFLSAFDIHLAPTVTIVLIISFSILMIADIPMMSLKVSQWTLAANWNHILFILISVPLLIVFQKAGISIVIIGYVIFSVVSFLVRRSIS